MPFFTNITALNEYYATERPVGPARIEYPFLSLYGDGDHKVISQDYVVLNESYDPPALNAAHPVHTGCVFVGDISLGDKPANLRTFTRQWANVPANNADYESYVASFPGLGYNEGERPRQGFTKTVPSQVLHEYFLIGDDYDSPADIPQIQATSFRYPYDSTDRDPLDIYLLASTTPTLAAYSANIGEDNWYLTMEPSAIEQYMGNIYRRSTRKVRAL